MSEEESAKAKAAPVRSPAPPIARVAPVLSPAAAAAARPQPGAKGPAQAPAPLRAAVSAPKAAISPKPPAVAAVPEAPSPEPSAPGTGARSAVESTVAELVTWRRDAERKIAHLESELGKLRHGGSPAAPLPAAALPPAALAPAPAGTAPLPPAKPDLERDPTGPLFPDFEHVPERSDTPWSLVGEPAAAAAPAPAPAPYVPPAAPVASHEFVTSPRGSIVPVITRREAPGQYDLQMKPGEYFDLPSELDGGRKKRVLVMLVSFVILAGLATLVITALASQR